VQFVIETGRRIAEVARVLEIDEGALGNWVNQWKRNNSEPEKSLSPMERASVPEMEDEIRKLWMGNEFLKRATVHSRGRCNARFAVVDHNEASYNRKRIHSTLGYHNPTQALNDYRSTAAAA